MLKAVWFNQPWVVDKLPAGHAWCSTAATTTATGCG